jgi:hypothetical protein
MKVQNLKRKEEGIVGSLIYFCRVILKTLKVEESIKTKLKNSEIKDFSVTFSTI